MYAFGQGTQRDFAKAYSYWSRAADKHLGTAMGNIAVLYTNGLGGVKKDKNLAAHWYRQAAEHRHFQSMLVLSTLYATGEGIEKDPIQAMAWAGLAASNAPNQKLKDVAVSQAQALGRDMSKEDLNRAQTVSDEMRLVIDANIKKYKEQ
jgi:TPR repeat protein